MEKNKAKAFAERVENIFIEYKRVKDIYRKLDSIRVNKRIKNNSKTPKHLFITGPSGSGKTQIALHYVKMNAGYIEVDEEGTEYDIKPVVYLEAPEPFTVGELYQSIIQALGAPRLKGSPKVGTLKDQAFALLEKQKVEMLIIDEIDYTIDSRHVKPLEAMKTFKYISNMAKVSVVCMGAPETEFLRKIAFQYFRRFPCIKLDKFADCNDEFCGFLTAMEEYIQPPKPLRLGDKESLYPQFLFRVSMGLVGVVTNILQEAYRLLDVSTERYFDINKAIITPNILMEAYKITLGDVDEEEFSRMLTMTSEKRNKAVV